MVCAPEQHGGKVPVPEITSHIRLLIRDRGQMHFVVGRIRGLERSPLPQAMRKSAAQARISIISRRIANGEGLDGGKGWSLSSHVPIFPTSF